MHMVKPIHNFKAGARFNVSAGGFFRGTGGKKKEKWWEIYDAAEAHYKEHGNLDAFFRKEDRYRKWRDSCRASRRNCNLTDDQIHFLKQIKFDFSPKKTHYSKAGIKHERTLDLIQEFQSAKNGDSNMSKANAQELLNNIRQYFSDYKSGKLIEKRGAELGVDDDDKTHEMIAELKSRLPK